MKVALVPLALGTLTTWLLAGRVRRTSRKRAAGRRHERGVDRRVVLVEVVTAPATLVALAGRGAGPARLVAARAADRPGARCSRGIGTVAPPTSFGFEAINRGIVRATEGAAECAARHADRPAELERAGDPRRAGRRPGHPGAWRGLMTMNRHPLDLADRCCPWSRRPVVYLVGPRSACAWAAAAPARWLALVAAARGDLACRSDSPAQSGAAPSARSTLQVGHGRAAHGRPGPAAGGDRAGAGTLVVAVFSVPYMAGEEGEEKYYACCRR